MPVDEIMTQSPSQTVSIYEALAEILSKPTESLNFSNSKSTDRTLFSEAPVSSTTPTTTTTTTSTTPLPPTTEASDDFKVENSTLDVIQNVNTTRVNNQQVSTEATASDIASTLNFDYDDLTFPSSDNPSATSEIPTENFENVFNMTTTFIPIINNNSHPDTTTPKEEFSTDALTTTLTDTTFIHLTTLTNNLTDLVNETNIINQTEIETTKTNLKLERHRLDLKHFRPYALNNVIRSDSIKTTTVPPSYSPRFSASNRIPILSFGSFREERNLDEATKETKIDLMTNRITKSGDEANLYSTPSVFPVYRPELDATTIMSVFPSSKSSFVARKKFPSFSSEVTEMIVTSPIMTLTESDTTTASTIEVSLKIQNPTEETETSTEASLTTNEVTQSLNEISTTTDQITFNTNEAKSFSNQIVSNFNAVTRQYDEATTETATQVPEETTLSSDYTTVEDEVTSVAPLVTEKVTMSSYQSETSEEALIISTESTLTSSPTISPPRPFSRVSVFTTQASFPTEISSTLDYTTLSKSLVDDINDLTIEKTSTTKMTTRKPYNSDVNPRSIECSSAPCSTKAYPTVETPRQFKHPKSLFPQPPPKPSHTTQPTQMNERVVYAILPNNTVVRKIILQSFTTEDPHVIYGVFPNKTVLRRFRNGTTVPDDRTTRIELTNIDPKSLTNPNSEFHQMSAENVLRRSAIATTTNLPFTDHIKTVFYLLIFINSR